MHPMSSGFAVEVCALLTPAVADLADVLSHTWLPESLKNIGRQHSAQVDWSPAAWAIIVTFAVLFSFMLHQLMAFLYVECSTDGGGVGLRGICAAIPPNAMSPESPVPAANESYESVPDHEVPCPFLGPWVWSGKLVFIKQDAAGEMIVSCDIYPLVAKAQVEGNTIVFALDFPDREEREQWKGTLSEDRIHFEFLEQEREWCRLSQECVDFADRVKPLLRAEFLIQFLLTVVAVPIGYATSTCQGGTPDVLLLATIPILIRSKWIELNFFRRLARYFAREGSTVTKVKDALVMYGIVDIWNAFLSMAEVLDRMLDGLSLPVYFLCYSRIHIRLVQSFATSPKWFMRAVAPLADVTGLHGMSGFFLLLSSLYQHNEAVSNMEVVRNCGTLEVFFSQWNRSHPEHFIAGTNCLAANLDLVGLGAIASRVAKREWKPSVAWKQIDLAIGRALLEGCVQSQFSAEFLMLSGESLLKNPTVLASSLMSLFTTMKNGVAILQCGLVVARASDVPDWVPQKCILAKAFVGGIFIMCIGVLTGVKLIMSEVCQPHIWGLFTGCEPL